jgi:hypothetical protein
MRTWRVFVLSHGTLRFLTNILQLAHMFPSGFMVANIICVVYCALIVFVLCLVSDVVRISEFFILYCLFGFLLNLYPVVKNKSNLVNTK